MSITYSNTTGRFISNYNFYIIMKEYMGEYTMKPNPYLLLHELIMSKNAEYISLHDDINLNILLFNNYIIEIGKRW